MQSTLEVTCKLWTATNSRPGRSVSMNAFLVFSPRPSLAPSISNRRCSINVQIPPDAIASATLSLRFVPFSAATYRLSEPHFMLPNTLLCLFCLSVNALMKQLSTSTNTLLCLFCLSVNALMKQLSTSTNTLLCLFCLSVNALMKQLSTSTLIFYDAAGFDLMPLHRHDAPLNVSFAGLKTSRSIACAARRYRRRIPSDVWRDSLARHLMFGSPSIIAQAKRTIASGISQSHPSISLR
jgi:hypothetical protein